MENISSLGDHKILKKNNENLNFPKKLKIRIFQNSKIFFIAQPPLSHHEGRIGAAQRFDIDSQSPQCLLWPY